MIQWGNSWIRYAKVFSIVGGSLITIVGTLWSFLVSDGLSQRGKELANQKAEARKQIEALNSIAADYFIANQQGDLIFILAQQPNARCDADLQRKPARCRW